MFLMNYDICNVGCITAIPKYSGYSNGFTFTFQRKTNAVAQALWLRGLRGKSKNLIIDSSLPEADLDNLQRQIADLKNELDIFSRDVAEIEEDYKDGKYEQENC